MFDLGYPLNYKRQVFATSYLFPSHFISPPPPIILSSFISSTLSWHHSEWQSTTMLMFVHISYYLRNLVISHWVLSDLIGVVWSHTTLKWCLDMLFLAGMVLWLCEEYTKDEHLWKCFMWCICSACLIRAAPCLDIQCSWHVFFALLLLSVAKKPLLQSHLQLCCHCCEPSVQVAFSSLLNIQRSGEVESCVTLLSL